LGAGTIRAVGSGAALAVALDVATISADEALGAAGATEEVLRFRRKSGTEIAAASTTSAAHGSARTRGEAFVVDERLVICDSGPDGTDVYVGGSTWRFRSLC